MALSHKYVETKTSAKIKIYTLTRAELLFSLCYEIPCRTLSISGQKSRVLKLSFLRLQMMVKSDLEFILKFTKPLQRYLLNKLLDQFSHSWQILLPWAAATLKGLGEFQNKMSRPSFFTKKC